MLLKSIMRPPTGSAASSSFVDVQVISFKLVAALAFFLRLLHGGMNSYGFFLRGGVVVLNRGIKKTILRPFLLQPVRKSANINSIFLGQFGKMVFDAINNCESRVLLISSLLRASCPAAVLRGIGTVIINAVKGHPWWSRTHVIYESLKRVHPAITDLDASRSVSVISTSARKGAAKNHHCPTHVERVRSFEHGFLQSSSYRIIAGE
jgi:hypothetical protein